MSPYVVANGSSAISAASPQSVRSGRCIAAAAPEIRGRAMQVALQDDADVVAPTRAQTLVETERRVDDRALLHVDPQAHAEVEQARGAREHQLVVEGDAEMGQLERDVGVQPFLHEP